MKVAGYREEMHELSGSGLWENDSGYFKRSGSRPVIKRLSIWRILSCACLSLPAGHC